MIWNIKLFLNWGIHLLWNNKFVLCREHHALSASQIKTFSIQSCIQRPKLHACAETKKHMPINPVIISSQTFFLKYTLLLWSIVSLFKMLLSQSKARGFQLNYLPFSCNLHLLQIEIWYLKIYFPSHTNSIEKIEIL